MMMIMKMPTQTMTMIIVVMIMRTMRQREPDHARSFELQKIITVPLDLRVRTDRMIM